MKKQGISIKDIVIPILVGWLLSRFIMNYLFVFTEVNSVSMESTISVGDKLIVNKFKYNIF